MSVRVLLAVLLAAAPAAAQEVQSCDGFVASARNVFWPDATRTFANGAIRLVHLDTAGEPACCSAHLMVTYPSPEDPFDLCALVSADGTMGWQGLSLSRADASYDPARGLTVRVPASEYGEVHATPLSILVTINQQTGEIRAEYGAP